MKKIVVALISILMLAPIPAILSNISSAEYEPIDGDATLEHMTVGTIYSWANVEYKASGNNTYIRGFLIFEKGSDAEASFLEDIVLKNKKDYEEYAEYYQKPVKEVTISAYKIIQRSYYVNVDVETVHDGWTTASSETLKASYPAGHQQYMFYAEKGDKYSISIEFPESDYSAKIVGSSTGEIADLVSGTRLTLTSDVTEDIVVALAPKNSITDSRYFLADVSIAMDGAYKPSDSAAIVFAAILAIAMAAVIAIYVGWRRFLPKLPD